MMQVSDNDPFGKSQRELRAQLDKFIETWAPEDPALRDQFRTDADLLFIGAGLVAQAPFLRVIAEAVSRQHVPPVVVEKRNSTAIIPVCSRCGSDIFGDSYVIGMKRYCEPCTHKV